MIHGTRALQAISTVLTLWLGVLPLAAEPQFFFCIAPDYKSRVVYITNVFHSTIGRERLQEALRAHLELQGRSYDVVQCPMPGELPDAAEGMNLAEKFNRESGFKIVHVPISNN